jgi:hypothetical protein
MKILVFFLALVNSGDCGSVDSGPAKEILRKKRNEKGDECFVSEILACRGWFFFSAFGLYTSSGINSPLHV